MNRKFLCCVALIFAALFGTAHSQYSNCGDANGNGAVNTTDVVYGVNYFFGGGPPPVNLDTADTDSYDQYTLHDIKVMIYCAFLCDFEGPCAPTQPPFSGPLDSRFQLAYDDVIPASTTTYSIRFGLWGAQTTIESFLAPVTVAIDGSPAQIDSVVYNTLLPSSVLPYSDIRGPGSLVLGALTVPTGSWDDDYLGRVYVTVPNLTSVQTVSLDWDTLSAAQAPVGEEGSLYPYFESQDFAIGAGGMFLPELSGNCCWNPGDFNHDRQYNITDVTAGVAYIFSGGDGPPCPREADFNGDGDFNIADVTEGILYIFSGGDAPVCGP